MFAHKDTSRTASAQELSEFPGMEEKKGFTISFTKRVMLVSIAVSLITIISSVVVLSAVWNQHFQSYTRENVQRVADGTAAAIADGYEQSNGDWYGGALSAATSASSLYDSVYLQVRTIDGTIVYDDRANDVLGSVDVKEDGSNVASAPIMVDGEKVGTVLVRVPGSEARLTKFDEAVRDRA